MKCTSYFLGLLLVTKLTKSMTIFTKVASKAVATLKNAKEKCMTTMGTMAIMGEATMDLEVMKMDLEVMEAMDLVVMATMIIMGSVTSEEEEDLVADTEDTMITLEVARKSIRIRKTNISGIMD